MRPHRPRTGHAQWHASSATTDGGFSMSATSRERSTQTGLTPYSGRLETGEILASWFLANPAGPTAYALGFVELEGRRRLFYRSMHFSGTETWLLHDLEAGLEALPGGFGGILFNSLINLNNQFTAAGEGKRPLTCIPSIVLLNDNAVVRSAFWEYLRLSTADADWGRETYYVTKYRND